MADFTGFEQGIFDYFFTHDDEDSRKWVRDTVKAFAAKLEPRVAEIDSFYAAVDVGTLRQQDEHAWLAFGPPGRTYRRHAHLTIVLDAAGIVLQANIELKPAVDRLRKKIERNPEGFQQALLALPVEDPFTVRIQERRQMRASRYTYHQVAELESAYFRQPATSLQTFAYLEQLLQQIPLPYVSVRKRVSRTEALELSREDHAEPLLARITELLAGFHPLVHYVNR